MKDKARIRFSNRPAHAAKGKGDNSHVLQQTAIIQRFYGPAGAHSVLWLMSKC
jgi:hypothetical protein